MCEKSHKNVRRTEESLFEAVSLNLHEELVCYETCQPFGQCLGATSYLAPADDFCG